MNKLTGQRLPRYKKAKTPPPMRLTDRDKRVIEAVYQFRFLTRDQIKLLEFDNGSMTACQRRLSLLFHNGYLAAIQKPVPGGYGSSKRAYCLSKKGKELISFTNDGKEITDIKWNEKNNKIEFYFLEHILAINDVRIAFINAALNSDYEVDWVPEWEIKAMKEKVNDPENPNKTLPITPDSFFALISKDKKACYFLEVDRATESNHRWRDKIRGYVEYVKSGNYYEKFKSKALRVLAVTTSPDRMANLINTTKTVDNAYFFLFTTFSEVQKNNPIFGSVWKTTGKEDLVRLL